MSETFLPANILMPQVDSMKKWAVIACDQFSSQPEYWDEVKEYVGNTPSTLHLMLPEAYLGSEEEDEKIRKIQSTMKNYADDHLLKLMKILWFMWKEPCRMERFEEGS